MIIFSHLAFKKAYIFLEYTKSYTFLESYKFPKVSKQILEMFS